MSDTELSTLQGLPNDSVPHPQQADNPQILEELRQAIDMGQGDFALLMVRCNYRNLQEQLLETLHGTTDLEIAEVTLAPKETSLYSAILAQVEESSPAALSVLELDQVEALDDVLASANHMRESFRQRFSFPLLLWVDDRLMAHIRRRMPDFKSWGATTFRFDLDTEALLAQLQATCDRYLEGALQRAAFTPTTDLLSPQDSREADLAVSELDRRRVRLPPNLAGSLEFHLGALLYGENPRPSPKTCEAALAHYQTGLAHWQTAQNALGIGLAHFYRSLCHAQQQDWDAAKRERQACLDAFTTAERPDLAARFVGSLGPVLVALEDWQELERCLPQWQALHKDQPTELAQDWSLQAEVAKHQQDWLQMQADSEKAIAIWTQRESSSPVPLTYRLQQCEALAQQGHVATAIEHLEAARRSHLPKEDPLAFVQLLNQLRQLYFQEKQYQKAFEIKQERRSIQYQFQMRAFIGAGQLQPQKTADPTAETHASFVASGRQEDINTLVNVRVSEPRHKLTVLCGLSGVGKSSLVRAGLVPALTGKQLRDRRALTVVMRIYSHWETALGEALYAALAAYPEARLEAAPTSAEQLKAQLRRNAEQHLLTVLIFDQFEEFFFICTQPAQRRVFYEFLRDCLKGTDIQFVKVIFSLREDYLHELLEFEDFVKDLGVDFLSREQRQRIENFTPAIARSVITELSQRTTLLLDADLVDALVDSLTNELGRIRPVELQVVGAQLEAEGITTLAKYRQLGENPKLVLAERWVGAVVADCGSENADAAWQVLVALTQENGTRPLLTMGELVAALEDYQRLLGTGVVSLESDILPVLVGSGLVVRWPQEPEDRYQLVHDYLVEPIRRRYNADYRQQLEQLVKGKQAAEAKQRQEEDRRKRLQRWTLRGVLGAVVVFAGLAAFAWVMAIRSYRLAKASERAEKLATARQLAAQAERILQQQPNLRPMAALLAVESYRRFTQQKHSPIEADVPLRKALNRLPQSVINIDHEDRVWVVSFSENSQYLATGSEDGTVKIIEVATGDEITSIEHGAGVKRVAFSENSQYLATGSEDGTVKIIEVATGNEITSIEHGAIANRVVFSEDNQYLATSSADGTAKLTEVATSNEIASIDHEETVWDISFSQDSQYLATSSADGTAKIIEVATGNEITSIDHEASATVLGFSQDSQYLITGSTDSIAKLVEVATGNEIASINHEASIRSVGFSQDSQYLATGSADSTAKLVEVPTGNEVVTIDHETMVDSVSFSQNSQYLATGSTDGTAKLIEVATGNEIATFDHGTAIDNVSFSQNSQYLVISSLDGTAKLIEVATGSEIANINHEVRYAKYQRIVRLISPLRQEEENRNVVFSENSQYFATGGLDGTAKLIEVATGKEIASINHERWVNRVIFSENSQYSLSRASAVHLIPVE